MIANPSTHGLEIAIVGMACRYPGSDTPRAFWRTLLAGEENIAFFSEEELVLAGMDPQTVLAPGYVRARGVLREPCAFDAGFFGIPPAEAEIIDPQQRVFLECAWEAFEDAGYVPDRVAGSVGVYAGAASSSYLLQHVIPNLKRLSRVAETVAAMGNQLSYLPTRVAYRLNLTGPAVAVATACSTSLVAVHVACKALLAGECDMALAGAAAIAFPEVAGYQAFADAGAVISTDGHCRPFDAQATGMVPASGVGIVLLKRLDEALRDGDHVYAVVKGSAINNDGHAKMSFLAPSVQGQSEVIRLAVQMAEVDPASIDFVEAHGTGTAVGDPIEVRALAEAYGTAARETPCAIGSVKSNIGHTQEAAGVAGLIKAALALERRVLPPSINVAAPNPELALEHIPFAIADRAVDWRADTRTLRAGVSSFGLGGTNAHVILEQAPPRTDAGSRRQRHVLAVSARTPAQLALARARLAERLAEGDLSLADAAYTTQVGRKAFPYRTAVVASTLDEAVAQLRAIDDAHFSHAAGAPGAAFAGGDAADADEIARQWERGADIAWEALHAAGARFRVSLPTYPFERRMYRLPAADTPQALPQAAAPPVTRPIEPPAAPADNGDAVDLVRERVTAVWCDLLGVTSVDDDASFFDLGGDSLLCARLGTHLSETFGIDIELRPLFEQPTLREHSRLIEALLVRKLEGLSEDELRQLALG